MSRHRNEEKLLADVKAGVPSAIERLVGLAETAIWPAVVALVGEREAADSAFLTIITELKRDGFRRLSHYDGRSELSTFLTLLARDLLGEEVIRLFALDRNRAWRRFDCLFSKDIYKRIRRRFPQADDTRRQDLFQRIALKLLEDDYRRIRSYDGRGSFTGYVLLTVDRLLIDILREEAPRRRLPAEIARLSDLHKVLFVAGAWQGIPLEPDRMMIALGSKIDPSVGHEELKAALKVVADPVASARMNAKVREISLESGESNGSQPEIASTTRNPEEILQDLENEQAQEALMAHVRREAESLSPELQLYLKVFLQSSEALPAREIAREMAMPVEQVYKLQQKMKLWMRNIGENFQKNSCPSV